MTFRNLGLIFRQILLLSVASAMNYACQSDPPTDDMLDEEPIESTGAAVSAVEISGQASNYTFTVEIISPDLGCNQYADWWEIISADEKLIYRRILAHSHVNEQPFRRAGGPILIAADSMIIIRAHMNNLGYGTSVLVGSVVGGFAKDSLAQDFAKDLAKELPLPGDCPN